LPRFTNIMEPARHLMDGAIWRSRSRATYVEGFQILDQPKRGRGALSKTANDPFVDLPLCLDVMRYKARGMSIKRACETLARLNPLYQGRKWKALLDRFNAADKRVVEVAIDCIIGALRSSPIVKSVVTAWLRSEPAELSRIGLLDLPQALFRPPPGIEKLAPNVSEDDLVRYEQNLLK